MTNEDKKDSKVEKSQEPDKDFHITSPNKPPLLPAPDLPAKAPLLPAQDLSAPHVGIPYEIRSPKVWQDTVRYQFLYSFAGLVLGLVCILGGIILFLRGVTGSTSWTAKVLGLESNITDAAPGAVLFIVGLFLVFITRFVIKTKKY